MAANETTPVAGFTTILGLVAEYGGIYATGEELASQIEKIPPLEVRCGTSSATMLSISASKGPVSRMVGWLLQIEVIGSTVNLGDEELGASRLFSIAATYIGPVPARLIDGSISTVA